MNDQDTYYTDLITRYFTGEASPEDIQLLSEWIRENDTNRKVFADYKQTWELSEQSLLDQKIDLDSEWSALKGKLNQKVAKPQKKVISIRQVESLQASRISLWRIAASVLVFLAAASVLFYYFTRTTLITRTADAGSTEVTLPDGSVITLNKGASLEYPSKFSGNKRSVKLKGEAYFNVAHDKTKPFIVTGDNVNIEVLGTMFNLNTHAANGDLSVVLASGKIALYFTDRTSDKLILLPGDKAEVSTTYHRIIKSTNSDPNFLSWKTGHIVFENVPLSGIVQTLNNVYHTQIVIKDNALRNCRITATFDHQPVSSILNVIKGTLDLQVTASGNTFVLSGKPCN